MSQIRQQDIVWVRFPYSDMREVKFRPAVVVSNNSYNRKHNDVIACAITSRLEEKEYGIPIDESKIASGKMPLKSMIRVDKIMQIEATLIARMFARLDNKSFDLLTERIMRLVKRNGK